MSKQVRIFEIETEIKGRHEDSLNFSQVMTEDDYINLRERIDSLRRELCEIGGCQDSWCQRCRPIKSIR